LQVAKRLYRCRECGNEVVLETNHQIDCYPVCAGKCRYYIRTGRGAAEQELVLRKQTAHEFIRDVDDAL